MYCKNCQTNNPEGLKKCLNCGKTLETDKLNNSLHADARKVSNWKLLEDSSNQRTNRENTNLEICSAEDTALNVSTDDLQKATKTLPAHVKSDSAATAAKLPTKHPRRAAPGRERPAGYVWHAPIYFDEPIHSKSTTHEHSAAQRECASSNAEKDMNEALSQRCRENSKSVSSRWFLAGGILLGTTALVAAFLLGMYTGTRLYSGQAAVDQTANSAESSQAISNDQLDAQDERSIFSSLSASDRSSSYESEKQSREEDALDIVHSEAIENLQEEQTGEDLIEQNASAASEVYILLESMNIRSEPNLDEIFKVGILPAGQMVEIVETLQDAEIPEITWGRMSDGQYVCLSDAQQRFGIPSHEYR